MANPCVLWVCDASEVADVEPTACFELALSPEERVPSATFAPLALARAFVSRLNALRPAQVRVDCVSASANDLGRLAIALGFETLVRVPAEMDPASLDDSGRRWLEALLTMSHGVVCAKPTAAVQDWLTRLGVRWQAQWPAAPPAPASVDQHWGYQTYAIGRRDHRLLAAMQEGLVEHFAGCREILDLGCGTGVFLDLLARAGYRSSGVERNIESVRYARALGLRVADDDALRYLEARPAGFDGLYCSHFVEHLPVEGVERLLRACATGLREGGVAVFVFPDPESIRSQLLGFWRDPEHVRFYHPELIELMAEPHGLVVEYSSARAEGRTVVPFAMAPEAPPPAELTTGPWQKILGLLGVGSRTELAAVRARAAWLETQMHRLWSVNQTWAWNDNAVLRMRKVRPSA